MNAKPKEAGAKAYASWAGAGAGASAALVGAIVIAGWHAQRMDIVRLLPSAAPMPYDAAACLVLCGAGMAALALGRRRAAAALGAAAAALAAWSILQALLGVDLGPDRLLAGAAREDVLDSMRMEPFSALAYLLAGSALATLEVAPRRIADPAALLLGSALSAFGAVVVLCHAAGIGSAFDWEHLTRVSPQTGLGLLLVGAGLIATARPRLASAAADSRWLPAAAGLGAAVATLFLWTALRAEEHVRIQYHVDAAAFELAAKLQPLQAAGGKSADLRPEQLFGMILRAHVPSPCAFAVFLGRKAVYTSPGAPEPRPEEYARNVAVRVGGTEGWVRLWPSAELLAIEHSRLPEAVGAVGLILSLLLAWSVHLSRLARRQARELAAAGAAKSRFLANIAREFGNPLNSIIGFSEILLSRQDGPLAPEQEQDLRAVRDGGRRLSFLMTELLELARLEAGKSRLSVEPVAARAVVEDMRRRFEAEAAKKGLSLRLELGARDGEVLADPEGLRRALARLVENAVKFTPRGEIALGLRLEDEEAAFSVWDTGSGIRAEEKHEVFEPFWQARRLDGVKKTEGLGLGLFLAKRSVELQGGTLAVEGTGRGTVFTVRLPRPLAAGRRTERT